MKAGPWAALVSFTSTSLEPPTLGSHDFEDMIPLTDTTSGLDDCDTSTQFRQALLHLVLIQASQGCKRSEVLRELFNICLTVDKFEQQILSFSYSDTDASMLSRIASHLSCQTR